MIKIDRYIDRYLLRIKMTEKTCYQKNKDVILNRAKNYYENDKAEIYLKKEKIKRENMEKTDIIIHLRKRNKN